MPTPRKSKAELALSGTLSAHPGRYRDRFDRPQLVIPPLGNAPTHLASPEKAAWAEIVRSAPTGILTRADRIMVELLAHVLVKVRSVDAKNSDVNLLISILGKLGMTPVDRAKMLIEQPAPAEPIPAANDPWAEFD